MSHINYRKSMLILMLSFVIAGCAPNRIYRDVYKVCNSASGVNCDQYSLQEHEDKVTHSDYLLGFVEIDDQGQLRDREQMYTLINKLYDTASKESVLINVFVHGWHHNAEPGDTNIEGFKKALAGLSRFENKKKSGQKRKVIGVYVGWRGESITIPVINGLTFWDRKNTAQDVGYLGVTELLVKLEEISNVRNSVEPPIKSRLVVIGHSFGAAVVYSATSQILMSRFVNSQPGKGFTDYAEGFGDLVVLLNPAFEALRYAPAHDLSQARCGFFDDQAPKLAILTSETDYATGMAFPLGRTFDTFFETHNEVKRNDCGYPMTLDEGEADRNTVGHYLPLVSHTLTPVKDKKAQQVARSGKIKNIWANQTSGGSTQFGKSLLTHLKKTVPRSPYLNIRVDKELMDGHNDIFRPEVTDFIELLIQMSTID